jgi:hypothetical protein
LSVLLVGLISASTALPVLENFDVVNQILELIELIHGHLVMLRSLLSVVFAGIMFVIAKQKLCKMLRNEPQ